MALNAAVTATRWERGIQFVTIAYTDGVRSLTEEYRIASTPPPEWAEKTAAARIAALEATDAAQITPGPIGPPTPEDPRAVEFRRNLRKLDLALKLMQIGVFSSESPEIVALVKALGSGVAEYWDLI